MNICGLGCLLLLIVQVWGNWEEVGERILNKIKNGLKHTVMNVKMCGLPRITNAPKNLTLDTGGVARFHCNVDMTCIVSYIEWYKQTDNDTREILRTGTDPGDPYSYTLTNVDQYDTGLYSCVAGNILGESVETAYLLVNHAIACTTISYWVVLTSIICTMGSGSVPLFSGFQWIESVCGFNGN